MGISGSRDEILGCWIQGWNSDFSSKNPPKSVVLKLLWTVFLKNMYIIRRFMIAMLKTWCFSWYFSLYQCTCNIRGISFRTPVIPSTTVLSFLVEVRMGGWPGFHWQNFSWNYIRSIDTTIAHWNCCNCCCLFLLRKYHWCFLFVCVPLMKQCPKRSRCDFLVKFIQIVVFCEWKSGA